MFERTLAVIEKILKDLKKVSTISDFVIQGVFLILCAYNVYLNLDSTHYLIIYSVLLAVSFAYFVFSCVTVKKKIGGAKKWVKFIASNFKLLFRFAIICISVYDIATTEVSDFTKIVTIVVIVGFFLQLIINFVTLALDRYINSLKIAFEEDWKELRAPIDKLLDAKETILHPAEAILKAVNKPMSRLAGVEQEEKGEEKGEEKAPQSGMLFHVNQLRDERIRQRQEEQTQKREQQAQERDRRVREETEKLKESAKRFFSRFVPVKKEKDACPERVSEGEALGEYVRRKDADGDSREGMRDSGAFAAEPVRPTKGKFYIYVKSVYGDVILGGRKKLSYRELSKALKKYSACEKREFCRKFAEGLSLWESDGESGRDCYALIDADEGKVEIL